MSAESERLARSLLDLARVVSKNCQGPLRAQLLDGFAKVATDLTKLSDAIDAPTGVADILRQADKQACQVDVEAAGFMHMKFAPNSAAIADKMMHQLRQQTALLEVLAKHADRADSRHVTVERRNSVPKT